MEVSGEGGGVEESVGAQRMGLRSAGVGSGLVKREKPVYVVRGWALRVWCAYLRSEAWEV